MSYDYGTANDINASGWVGGSVSNTGGQAGRRVDARA
jgi:hypothetical protein